VAASDFKCDAGIQKLLSLGLDFHTPQAMRFTTVAEDTLNEPGNAANYARSRLMRLSTKINLDSTLAVRYPLSILHPLLM